jgi:hypothetical protein
MSEYLITEVNCETGQVTERKMTADEAKQRAADDAIYAAYKNAQVQAEANKVAAQSKLEALGLTADDLKALGL